MRRVRSATAALALLAGTLLLAACAPATPGLPGLRPAASASAGAERSGAPSAPDAHPAEPTRAASGAFTVGSGSGVTIELWVDYFCPYCRMFEEANGDYLQGLVDGGEATLRIHPIAILDRASMGTKYSTRSANAASCVAEYAPDGYSAFHRELYAVQPEEGTEGLPDEQLVSLAPSADDVADCIRGQWFSGWIAQQTEDAIDGGVRGTPTVIVGGKRFEGSANDHGAFRSFIESVSAKA